MLGSNDPSKKSALRRNRKQRENSLRKLILSRPDVFSFQARLEASSPFLYNFLSFILIVVMYIAVATSVVAAIVLLLWLLRFLVLLVL